MTDRSRESSQLIKTLAQVRLLEDREPRNWSGGGGLEMVVVVMVVVVMVMVMVLVMVVMVLLRLVLLVQKVLSA